MAEVASLVLAVDSGQVAPAVAELNKLDTAAQKVATSVDRTEKEVRELGAAARSMSDGITQTVTRFEQMGAASSRMSTTLDQAGASFGRFQSGVASASASFGGFTRNFQTVGPAANNAGAAVGKAGDAAGKAANGFGLARHQVANLAQQFQDVAVSLGSGQGFATVLLQQGPQITSAMGGVSNSISIVKDAIGRIPTAVKVAGAGLGIVGAVTAAAAALAGLNADLEKTEAKIRTFNTPDTAESIIKTSKASASGTGLDPSALTNLEQLSQRQRQQLGLLEKDIGSLSSAAAKLAVQMHATGEESQGAITTLTRMLSQTTITGAEAVRFAQAFPQFAGAMAAAFDVPLEKLLELGPTIMRTNAAIAQAVVKMGEGATVTPTFAIAMNDLWNAVQNAAVSFEKLTGFGASFTGFARSTATEINGIAAAFGKMASAAQAAAEWASKAIGAGKAGTSQSQNLGGLGGQADMGMPPVDPAQAAGAVVTGEQFGPQFTNAVEQAIKAANDPLIRAVDGAAEKFPTNDALDQVGNQITGELKNNMGATVNGFAGVGQRFASGVTVWQSGNSAVKGGVDQNTSSTRAGLASVEGAIRSLNLRGGGGGGGGDGRTMGPDGRLSEPSTNGDWTTGSTGGFVYGAADRARSDPDGDGYATTKTGDIPQGTHQISGSGFGIRYGGAHGGGGGGYSHSPLNFTGVGYRESFQGGSGTASWGFNGNSTLGGGSSFGLGGMIGAGDLTADRQASGAAEAEGVREAIAAALAGADLDFEPKRFTPDGARGPAGNPYARSVNDNNPDAFYRVGDYSDAAMDMQEKLFQTAEDQYGELQNITSSGQQLLQATSGLPDAFAKALATAMADAGLTGEAIAAAIARAGSGSTGSPTAAPLASRSGPSQFLVA
jgi:hypothetical protein